MEKSVVYFLLLRQITIDHECKELGNFISVIIIKEQMERQNDLRKHRVARTENVLKDRWHTIMSRLTANMPERNIWSFLNTACKFLGKETIGFCAHIQSNGQYRNL